MVVSALDLTRGISGIGKSAAVCPRPAASAKSAPNKKSDAAAGRVLPELSGLIFKPFQTSFKIKGKFAGYYEHKTGILRTLKMNGFISLS